ncbi:Etl1, partial [Symbiodinium microadriaticum]
MKSNDRALRAINRSSKQVQKRRINISDDSDNDDEKIADSRCRLTGGNAPNTIVVLSGSEGDGVDADDTAPDGVYSRWQDSDSDEDEVLSARKAAAAASRYQSEVEKKSSQDYQVVGVNWLKLLHSNDVNGVLADDMGLG